MTVTLLWFNKPTSPQVSPQPRRLCNARRLSVCLSVC